jgi:hypothetical protein
MDSIELLQDNTFGNARLIGVDLEKFHTGLRDILEGATGVSISPRPTTALGRSIYRKHLEAAFRECISNHDVNAASRILVSGNEMLNEIDGSVSDISCHQTEYALATNWLATRAGRSMMKHVQDDLPSAVTFAQPTDQDVILVADAIGMLNAYLGDLGATTVLRVAGAVLIEKTRIQSAFMVPMPEISVLNRKVLSEPLVAADAILHEACHQKLYDIIATRRIVRADVDYMAGQLFEIPWNPVDNQRRVMDALRILSALHVYAHLLALSWSAYTQTEDRRTLDRLVNYWQRAKFFSGLIESGTLHHRFAGDGRQMLDWLVEIISVHTHNIKLVQPNVEDVHAKEVKLQRA